MEGFFNLHSRIVLNKEHKVKNKYIFSFLFLFYIFAFSCGFYFADFGLSKVIFSPSVFASVFASLIFGGILIFLQNKKQSFFIMQEKIKLMEILPNLLLFGTGKQLDAIKKVSTLCNAPVLLQVQKLLAAIKMEGKISHNLRLLEEELLRDLSAKPGHKRTFAKFGNIYSKIHFFINASRLEAMFYMAKNSNIFICSTETIPGFFCHINEEQFAKEIFLQKNRSGEKPLAIYTSNPLNYIESTALVDFVINALEGESYTLITKVKPDVKLNKYCVKDAFVGLRFVPKSHLFYKMISSQNLTLLGTSVNISGETAMLNMAEIKEKFKDVECIDLSLEGASSSNLPSAIFKINGNQVIVLRNGEVATRLVQKLKERGCSQATSAEGGEEKETYIVNL